MRLGRFATALWAGVVALGGLRATDGQGRGEENPAVGPQLGAPEVIRTDWNVGALVAADFDHDGRGDFAIVNPDRLRIEVYLRRNDGDAGLIGDAVGGDARTGWVPSFTNAPFERILLRIGRVPNDLCAADVDGDGDRDLIAAVGGDRLEIFLGDDNGFENFETERIEGVPVARDRHRIFVPDAGGRIGYLGDDRFMIWERGSEGIWELTQTHRLIGQRVLGGELGDFDGDGKLDLAYVDRKTPGFLHWIPSVVETSTLGQMIHLGTVRNGFLGLDTTGSGRELITLAAEDALVLKGRLTGGAGEGRYSTVETVAATTAVGFGNGRESEWVLADSEVAEIVWIRGGSRKEGRLERFPSFRGIEQMEAIEGSEEPGRGILLFSGAEGFVGFSAFDPLSGFSFPTVFETAEEPVRFGWDPLARRVAVAVRKRRTDYALHFFEPDGKGWSEIAAPLELDGIKRAPTMIRFATLAPASEDRFLLLLVDREPLIVFRELTDRESGETGWERVESGVFPGEGTDGLDPRQVTSGDIDGDGVDELYVASTGFIRQYRFEAASGLEITRQFNAPGSDLELFSPVIVPPVDSESVGRIEALAAAGDQRVAFAAEGDGGAVVYAGIQDALPSAADRMLLRPSDPDGGEFAFLGSGALMLPSANGPLFHYDPATVYSNPDPEVSYIGAWAGDLGSDGSTDLVLLSPGDARLEILTRSRGPDASGWERRLWFRVFEKNIHASGRGQNRIEPREVDIFDATGDDRADLVVLVHDRVLIYPAR